MLSYYLWVFVGCTKEAHFGLSPAALPQSSLLLAQLSLAPGQQNTSGWSKNGGSAERLWIITGGPLCPPFPLAVSGPSEQLVQHQRESLMSWVLSSEMIWHVSTSFPPTVGNRVSKKIHWSFANKCLHQEFSHLDLWYLHRSLLGSWVFRDKTRLKRHKNKFTERKSKSYLRSVAILPLPPLNRGEGQNVKAL